jgi:hypothetical protein
MMLNIHLRSFAAALLQSALKIAPPYAAEWGRAMLGELHHVEGDWAALAWAAGGAGVLAKQAFLSLLIPGGANQIGTSGGSELHGVPAQAWNTLQSAQFAGLFLDHDYRSLRRGHNFRIGKIRVEIPARRRNLENSCLGFPPSFWRKPQVASINSEKLALECYICRYI